jgi:mRNA interferase RelE/StbE
VGKYKIEFSNKAAKDYSRLPENYKSLINLAFSKLSEGIPVDIKPVVGEKDTYRIRVGRYRILFAVVDKVVLVTKIKPRGDVYK